MPYARTLQQYLTPDVYVEPPEAWERRLREVSPIAGNLDHLVFRYFAPMNPDGSSRGWRCPEHGQWVLYSARPIALCHPELRELHLRHWSELPEDKQAGRKAIVSDYQHFMWHSRGLWVRPFLILQGAGGTPAKYTATEEAFLAASDLPYEPFQIGDLPACPFDGRVVEMIAKRDRLIQHANDYDELLKSDKPDALKALDEEAQRVKRETYLDTWRVMIQPQADFMTWYLSRSERREEFPEAPKHLPNTLSKWRDEFMQTGKVIGARVASQRQVHALLT